MGAIICFLNVDLTGRLAFVVILTLVVSTCLAPLQLKITEK